MEKDIIAKNFLLYLSEKGLSRKTLRNYKSDLSHFNGWLILKVRAIGVLTGTLSEAIPFINKKTASDYKEYLSENIQSIKTINRRLSTLRHLSRFLTENQILNLDFTQGVSNLSTQKDSDLNPVIIQFEKHLEYQKASKNTVKSYVSDIRQFISWLDENKVPQQSGK